MWWKKKPVTHATALWILIGTAAAVLLVIAWYILALTRLASGLPAVYPAKTRPTGVTVLPSLFGRVKGISSGRLEIDSKQPFTSVLYDETTAVTSIAGGPFDITTLKLGAIITATGKDSGNGALAAAAIAVIENGNGMTAPLRGAGPGLLNPPSDWTDWWKTLPALIGWGTQGSEYVAALRGYAPLVPSVSVELYGRDGKLAGRIELNVTGYARMKPKNAFLTPQDAETQLMTDGIAAGGDDLSASLSGASASGAPFTLVPPDRQNRKGLLIRSGGALIAAVPYAKISFAKNFPNAPIAGSYWLSPDKRWLLAVFTAPQAEFGPLRSVHLLKLSDLGLK